MKIISTGLLGLDKILGGGIKSGTITDIFGAAGTGKTQIVMQISLNSLHDGLVFYQDTSATFRPERLLEIIKLQNRQASLLDNMIVARITNTAEQLEYVKKISDLKPSLVIIENVIDLFAFEYSKEANSLQRHVRFMEYMHTLSMACIKHEIPVIITNTVKASDQYYVESMAKSVSIFTHKKIKLEREGKKFVGTVTPAFGKKSNFHTISPMQE